MAEWILALPVLGGLMALFAFTLKHAVNGDRHPKKSDIVYRDMCKKQQDHVGDKFIAMSHLIQQHAENEKLRLDDLKEDLNRHFERIERFINGRLDG